MAGLAAISACFPPAAQIGAKAPPPSFQPPGHWGGPEPIGHGGNHQGGYQPKVIGATGCPEADVRRLEEAQAKRDRKCAARLAQLARTGGAPYQRTA
jgi:hypothetical protein